MDPAPWRPCKGGRCAHVCTHMAADQPDPWSKACLAEVFAMDAGG